MISQKAIFALRVILLIAKRNHAGPVQAADISKATGVSTKYLEVILSELKASRLLKSEKGCLGGYNLTKPATQITFLDVIGAVDGPLSLAPCVCKTKSKQCTGCFDKSDCIIGNTLKLAGEAAGLVLARHRFPASDRTQSSSAMVPLSR
jgi:Rrf2 family protein